MKAEQIAKVCHQANKAYCETLGDHSQLPWNEAPQWQKQSAMAGVEHLIKHPRTSPKRTHDLWLKQKTKDGWKYGKIKDVDKKEHPCFVEYDELPEKEKVKDKLFKNIVNALS